MMCSIILGMKKKTVLSREEIKHLAKLANLSLTEEEIEKYRKQLTETVEFVDNLNELNTERVNATSQTTNLTNVLFEDGDKNTRALSTETALKNAKKKKDNYFVVKRIM